MAAPRLPKIKKIQLPSLESLREKARKISLKDLLKNHRDCVLFAAMLLVFLYTMYMLVVEPGKRRMSRLETEQTQLQEEIQALSEDGVAENAETLQVDLNRLEKEVRKSQATWKVLRSAGIQEGVSKGEFLREITLVPYSIGWKILAVEELADTGEEGEGFLETTHYRVTGEGAFSALFHYLQRIENATVPAIVLEMDLKRTETNRQTLKGSFVLRVIGLEEDEAGVQTQGEDT